VAEARPRFRWGQLTAPSFEPLTTAELKAHLRVDLNDEDALIAALGVAARDWCERQTGHIMCSRSFYLEAEAFPEANGDIVLPIGPIAAVTQVAWRTAESSGDTVQTGVVDTDYRVTAALGRIRPMPTATSWPRTAQVSDAVQVTATVGYATAAAVPEIGKHAIRLLVGHWFENREAVVNGTISSDVKLTVDALLSPLKVREMLL
jgi:uncharacterized phiE125 gp8 family phage protein